MEFPLLVIERFRKYQNGRFLRSTLPPVIIIPIFFPKNCSLFFITPARGREQEGSHIIFRCCQINFIDSMISSSVIRIIDFTSSSIIGKLLSPS